MRIAFLLYDQLTQLDMTGPAQVLSRMPGAQVEYVAKTMDPVMSDCRLALMPTLTPVSYTHLTLPTKRIV